MGSRAWSCGIALCVLLARAAAAQFTTAFPPPTSAASLASGVSAGGGSFLMGSDSCIGPHTLIPPGPHASVPFTTGTTGTQGQQEGNCKAFGSTGIHNDVWFDWEATETGSATLTTCTLTTIDTKIAVYPQNDATCPSAGTSIVCNEDACSLQSRVTWAVAAGTTYTIQVGTFPGASGGSGTFSLTQSASDLPCGQYDDGTPENALGLSAGGEIGWLHRLDCLSEIDGVATAYGIPGGNAPPAGAPSSIAVYEDGDCDADATTALQLRHAQATVVTNPGTLVLNANPIVPPVAIPSACAFVMATCQHLGGQRPAAMDMSNPTPAAWLVGQSLAGGGVLDLTDLNDNDHPPSRMQTNPTAWLLRASGTAVPGSPYPDQCFGESCPCLNGSAIGGCDNTLPGNSGAFLSGSGSASLANDTLVLAVSSTPNHPGMFFQGDLFLTPAIQFGAGLLCCGESIVRCGVYLPTANATNTSSGIQIGGNAPPISDIGPNASLVPGDVRCYQWWYRDPTDFACFWRFNLSNSIRVTWGP